MIQFLVYLLNTLLLRKGYSAVKLVKPPPVETHRDHEYSGWYGYLRECELRLQDQPKIHEGADTNESGESYYVLSLAFDIQDKIIDIPISLPLPDAIKMVVAAQKSENFIEELAKASEKLVNDFKEAKSERLRKMIIRISFPGQPVQEIEAPEHILNHFKKNTTKLPFIEVVWDSKF